MKPRNFVTLLAVGAAFAAINVGPALAGQVVWWTPNWGAARAQKLAADFEAANPGIKIKIETTVSDGLPQRVLTALQSGAAPDIIEVQHSWISGYARNNLVMPLGNVIQDRADYNKGAIDNDTWKGVLYGIPYRVETRAIIFNRGDFKAVGLDPDNPPQTWASLVKAAAKLTHDGKSGYAITGGGEVSNTLTSALPYVWENGGAIISKDLKKAIVNQPAAVNALKFYTDFYKKGYSPRSTIENDGNANRRLFIAGAVSAYLGGPFDIATIRKQNPKIDIGVMMIPHPAGKQSAALLAGWSYIVPKEAKNPDEAKKFLQFLNTTDNQAYFTDTFPARKSSLKAARFHVPIMKGFLDQLAFGRPAPTLASWVQIGQSFYDGVQRVLLGDQTVQQSMDQANQEIQALLNQ